MPQFLNKPNTHEPHSRWQGLAAVILLTATFISSLFGKQSSLEYLGIAGFGLLALFTLALWCGRPWRGGQFWLPLTLVAAFWIWWWFASFLSPVGYISAGANWKMATLPAVALSGLLLAGNTRFLHHSIVMLSLVIAALAVYGCVQFFFMAEKPTATFINRNNFAALQLPIIMLATTTTLTTPTYRYQSLLALMVAALLVFVVGLIGSRGALFALLTGLALVFILAWREQVSHKRILITISSIALALVAANFAGLGNLGERVGSLSDPEGAGQSRIYIWEGALNMAAEAPWHGVGPGLFYLLYPKHRLTEDRSDAYYAHNDYLQFLIEAGWPALLLITLALLSTAWLVLRSLIQARGTPTQRLQIMALFSGLAAVAAHSLITFNFYLMPILVVMGLLLAQLLELLRASNLPAGLAEHEGSAHPLWFIMVRTILTLALLIPASYFSSMVGGSLKFKEAISQFESGNTRKGEAYLEQAIGWWPEVDLYHYTYAWQLLQRLMASSGKDRDEILIKAHEHLDEAQGINPYRPQTYIIRGLIYQTAGTAENRDQTSTEAAEQAFRAALKRDPFSLQARYKLARLLLGDKRIEDGVEVLEAGIDGGYEATPLTLNYYFLTAELRRILGDTKGHRQLMDKIEALRARIENEQKQAIPKASAPFLN